MRRLFRKKGNAGQGGLSAAALAPMVDLLTILLVAILRTWSTDPPLQLAEEGFELPVSRAESPLQRGVTVDVGSNALYVDGWRADSSKFWLESDDVLIRGVHEALQARGSTEVLIRADKDVPWALVGKVLFTAQQAGYSDIELVAVSQASL